MDFRLNEQEIMLQRTAREFAAQWVQPRAAEIDRSGQFPDDLAQEMGRLGYQGLPYPAAYGGSGAGYTSFILVLEQIGQASMTAAAILAVNALSQEAIFHFGTEQQKATFLTPLARGEAIGCWAFTDPETGSDPQAFTTTVTPRGDGYVINGQKQFVALAPAGSIAVIFARHGAKRLDAFIVDTSTPGFNRGEPCDTMGLRGLGTAVVYLDDVYVPRDHRLGAEGQGFDILLEAISVGRLGVAIQAVAVAQSALDLAIDYARQRRAMGRPITKLPTIQWLLAEMAARVEAARWLVYRTAFLRDLGQDIKYHSAVAKLFAPQAAVEVTRMAMQVTGAYGTMQTMAMERLYRDAKMTEIYEGVAEIQRSIIASYLTR